MYNIIIIVVKLITRESRYPINTDCATEHHETIIECGDIFCDVILDKPSVTVIMIPSPWFHINNYGIRL